MTSSRPRLVGIAVAIGLAALGLAGVSLQAIGQPANHSQLEAAHSAVSRLNQGETPSAVFPSARIDIASSTDVFVIVTDPQRNVLASSATLSGSTVLPPAGVFDYVKTNGEDRVTWQPAAGVRSWIVVDAFSGGFVIAGRTPSGTEQNSYVLLLWGSFGALALAAVAGLAAVLAGR